MLTFRRLPLIVFLLFFSSYFSLSNPGYFWDDWVWIFKGKEEAIRIGRELGVWWGGYATYAINSLPNPALFIRWFVFLSWGVASLLLAKCAQNEGWINQPTAFILAMLNAIVPVALVRYQTSVAFYCLYIAFFWAGSLVFLKCRNNKLKLISLPLFFFSFYLNSLLVLYVCLIVYVFVKYHLVRKLKIVEWKGALMLLARDPGREFAIFRVEFFLFLKRHKTFIFLPAFFYGVKWATAQHSQMYADYNAIQFSNFFWNALQVLPTFLTVNRDLVSVAYSNSSAKSLVVAFVINYLLLMVAFRGKELLSSDVGQSIKIAGIGILFGCFAIIPYMLVGKPPVLKSYYEARHILPGMPAILLFQLGCFGAILALVRRDRIRIQFGYIFISYLFSSFSMASMFIGADVWRDWMRQELIAEYIKNHKENLKKFGTFIIVDRTSGYRVLDRKIWNYEYTGNIIYARGGRNSLGVDVNEYRAWGNDELLLNNVYYRERYNISHYNPSAGHVFIEISNGKYRPSLGVVFGIAAHSLMGENWKPRAGKFFEISHHEEARIYFVMVERLRLLVRKLETYKKNHGAYPLSNKIASLGSVSLKTDGSISPVPLTYEDTVGKNPGDRLPGIGEFNMEPGFVYYSNGLDYKLIYKQAPDYDYAKLALPKNADLRNSGYGFWTRGAEKW